jgi:rod shape-determining protein MreD
MLNTLKLVLLLIITLLLQVTILPAHLADPFKPNLLILIVTYLGLKTGRSGGFIAFSLGLLHDCYSGIYLGLHAFCYLCHFVVLHMISNRLYTESRFLMVFVVFLATIANGLLHLFLLMIFSTADGIYGTLLTDLIPQAMTNAAFSFLIFSLPGLKAIEESR